MYRQLKQTAFSLPQLGGENFRPHYIGPCAQRLLEEALSVIGARLDERQEPTYRKIDALLQRLGGGDD